jgi:hypothetical protein
MEVLLLLHGAFAEMNASVSDLFRLHILKYFHFLVRLAATTFSVNRVKLADLIAVIRPVVVRLISLEPRLVILSRL